MVRSFNSVRSSVASSFQFNESHREEMGFTRSRQPKPLFFKDHGLKANRWKEDRQDTEKMNSIKYEPPLAKEPSIHPPGSKGKIMDLAKRVSNGEALWHPEDADLSAFVPGEEDFEDYISSIKELQ